MQKKQAPEAVAKNADQANSLTRTRKSLSNNPPDLVWPEIMQNTISPAEEK